MPHRGIPPTPPPHPANLASSHLGIVSLFLAVILLLKQQIQMNEDICPQIRIPLLLWTLVTAPVVVPRPPILP